MKGATNPDLAADLLQELSRRVARGEFPTLEKAIDTCVRYYLERHRENALKDYLKQEVEAGLNESA